MQISAIAENLILEIILVYFPLRRRVLPGDTQACPDVSKASAKECYGVCEASGGRRRAV